MPKKYDFAGWVTRTDIKCSDGAVIKQDAFKHCDGKQVPLVWNHGHQSPNNVLGNVRLRNREGGVYGYGFFNNSPEGKHAKELVQHGDINSMSIGANKVRRLSQDVIHGNIFEVSLVLSGANPGAMIDAIMTHSDVTDEEYEDPTQAIVYTGNLIHSYDAVLHSEEDEDDEEEIDEEGEGSKDPSKKPKLRSKDDEEDEDDEDMEHSDKTIGDVLDTLSEEQMNAVENLVANIISDESEEGTEMKQNAFDTQNKGEETMLLHSELNELLFDAREGKASSFKELLNETMLEHGITNIEELFPEAKELNPTPLVFGNINTATDTVINGVRKSPFSKVKSRFANLTHDEARAKGYIKGTEKKEQWFPIMNRTVDAQTVYKKQQLDRDDIIDITDFDIVPFIQKEMRQMLHEELARAILVGDGREVTDPDKIKETNIIPIFKDHSIYTIKNDIADPSQFMENIIRVRSFYRGSGQPTLFIDPLLLADVLLQKAADGRYLFGDIPSKESMAAKLGVSSIVETTFLTAGQYIMVNLNDYVLGANKGGQVTTFDDFDIDFNLYKYLIETRVSGALVMPKSAIVGTVAGVTAAPEGTGISYEDMEDFMGYPIKPGGPTETP